MVRISGRQIAQELKQGDQVGCRHLVAEYQDLLLTEAVGVFHLPREDAEELVSDALLAVINGISTFEFKRSEADFHLWVVTIFRNRVRDFIRHAALTEGLMEGFDESLFDGVEECSTSEREVMRSIVRGYEESLRVEEDDPGGGRGSLAQKLRIVEETLEKLKTWERVLLRCRALDIPYEDIARYTGKPVQHLKVYHARVKRRFIQLLAEHYPELAEL